MSHWHVEWKVSFGKFVDIDVKHGRKFVTFGGISMCSMAISFIKKTNTA